MKGKGRKERKIVISVSLRENRYLINSKNATFNNRPRFLSPQNLYKGVVSFPPQGNDLTRTNKQTNKKKRKEYDTNKLGVKKNDTKGETGRRKQRKIGTRGKEKKSYESAQQIVTPLVSSEDFISELQIILSALTQPISRAIA